MGYAIGKQNTTSPIRFLMVLSSDHITGATGKTPTVTIAKNTGSFATPAGAVTEIGAGWYSIAPNAVDASTLGPLLVHATATACDPTDDQFDVVDYNPFQFQPVTTVVGPTGISATDIINDGLEIIGVKDPNGPAVPAQAMNSALRRLNQIIDGWSLMSLTIPAIAREVFPLVAGQGGPSNPYTIGPTGDFVTSRPTSITNVGLNMPNQSPAYELSRFLFTEDAYDSIVLKEFQSTYFSGLYFNPTYAAGLATIQVWPVPSDDSTEVVIYRPVQLSRFATLTSTYDMPPGSTDALTYEFARRSALPFGRPWSAQLQKDCNDYLSIYQRSNTKMADLSMDAALTPRRGLYNILSDGGN